MCVHRLDWIDDMRFDLDGVSFVASVMERFHSSRDQFLLVKPRPLIERHLKLLDEREPRNIVELGIGEGGSRATVVRGVDDIDPQEFALADCYNDSAARLFNG